MKTLTTTATLMVVLAMTMAPTTTALGPGVVETNTDSADLLLIGEVVRPKSCSVTASNPSCTFYCAPHDEISVSASNTDGQGVGITGSCGGETASCSNDYSSCQDTEPGVESFGEGVCMLSKGTAGSCAANGNVPALIEIATEEAVAR